MKTLFLICCLLAFSFSNATSIVVTPRTSNLPAGWVNRNNVNLKTTVSNTYNLHTSADTLYIQDTLDYTFGTIQIGGLRGTSGSRIPIVFQRWSMAFGGSTSALVIDSSSYFTLVAPGNGTGNSNTPKSNYLYINGQKSLGGSRGGVQIHQSDHYEVGFLYVTDVTGFGFQAKTDADSLDRTHTEWPYYTQDSIYLHDIMVLNTDNEGFYLGRTTTNGNPRVGPNDTVSPLRYLKVRRLYTKHTGWDGMQFSYSQYTDAYNLQIIDPAYLNASSQSTGLPLQNGTSGTFDSIYIRNPTATAIQYFTNDTTYLKNVTIDLASPTNYFLFGDNRVSLFNQAPQVMYINNLQVRSTRSTNTTQNPIYILNGTSGGAVAANPGLWANIIYSKVRYTQSVIDNVHNSYCGGTLAPTVACPTTKRIK